MSEKQMSSPSREKESHSEQINENVPNKGLFNSHSHDHAHSHGHSHTHSEAHSHVHSHTHGAVDPSVITTSKGLWL